MELDVKRGLTILAGWLESVGVPFTIAKTTIVVQGPAGGLRVKVVGRPATSPNEVCADTLTGPQALDTFWGITERAGLGRPSPVDRGDAPRRVRFTEAPELVAMRHREFRQVANPPAEVFQDPDHRRIITWYCVRFFRSNGELCGRVGYDVDDLKTYAWLYLTNFYGRWRHLDVSATENRKMLCAYLQQRFYSDLKPLLQRKARSIAVDMETAALGQDVEYRWQWRVDHAEERRVSVAIRAPQQGKSHEELLEEMDHESLLTLFRRLVNGGNAKARRFLTLHREECLDCGQRVECEITSWEGVATSF